MNVIKFVYTIDFNLRHPLIKTLSIASEYPGCQTVAVNSYDCFDMIETIKECKKVVKGIKKQLKKQTKTTLKIDKQLNPFYFPEDELSALFEEDMNGMNENELAKIELNEVETEDWLVKATICAYHNSFENQLYHSAPEKVQ